MKIICINGSHRKTGATAKIIEEFIKNLSIKEDVEITNINLTDLQLHFCTGCCACYKTGTCYLKDDAESLSQMIHDADGVIIGSPTYASAISGQLKTFIDRGHFVIEQLLKGKHTVVFVTYENADGHSVMKYLRKLAVFSGTKTFDKMIVKLPFQTNPLENTKTVKRIKKKSDILYKAIVKQKSSKIVSSIHGLVFHFGIKPFVIKKGESYKGVLKHWENRGIHYK